MNTFGGVKPPRTPSCANANNIMIINDNNNS